MENQQKLSAGNSSLLVRLALLALVVPLVIWLDVLAMLWWGDGILSERAHEFHNRLPAAAQVFLWLGLPVIAIVLGVVSLARRQAAALSRTVIASSAPEPPIVGSPLARRIEHPVARVCIPRIPVTQST